MVRAHYNCFGLSMLTMAFLLAIAAITWLRSDTSSPSAQTHSDTLIAQLLQELTITTDPERQYYLVSEMQRLAAQAEPEEWKLAMVNELERRRLAGGGAIPLGRVQFWYAPFPALPLIADRKSCSKKKKLPLAQHPYPPLPLPSRYCSPPHQQERRVHSLSDVVCRSMLCRYRHALGVEAHPKKENVKPPKLIFFSFCASIVRE